MDGPPGFSNHLRARLEPALKPARRICMSVEGVRMPGSGGTACSGFGKIRSIRSRHKEPVTCIAFGKSVVAAC
jgi:hypothetical protein